MHPYVMKKKHVACQPDVRLSDAFYLKYALPDNASIEQIQQTLSCIMEALCALFESGNPQIDRSIFKNDDEKIILFSKNDDLGVNYQRQNNAITFYPSLIPWMYETLLGRFSKKQRANDGVYYTSADIADEMIQCAVAHCLKQIIPDIADSKIDDFIINEQRSQFNSDEIQTIYHTLTQITLIDPACGAGAFIIRALYFIARRLHQLKPSSSFHHHLNQVQKNVYGIDIQKHAVDITLKRLQWLCPIETTNNLDALKKQFYIGNALDIHHHYPRHWPKQFDIVIGNPPYGVPMTADEKKYYRTQCQYLKNRFDIYMAFFELSFERARHALCFITPDKWLSNHGAAPFRDAVARPHLSAITYTGRLSFDCAQIDGVISLFSKKKNDSLIVKDRKTGDKICIDKQTIPPPYSFDISIVPPSNEILRIDKLSHKLSDFADVSYAFAAVQDAYKLNPLLQSLPTHDSNLYYKIVNTGTIDKWNLKWGIKKMRYLNQYYPCPCVAKSDFFAAFPPVLTRKLTRPKLILKGLNRLDVALDLDGNFISAIATLNIFSSSPQILKILAAILNTDAFFQYLKYKYRSNTYNGALRYTPDMLLNLPMFDLSRIEPFEAFLSLTDLYLDQKISAERMLKKCNDLVKHLLDS